MPNGPHVLNVLLTVDTEINEPLSKEWLSSGLEREWERDIIGTSREGDYGLPFQMQVLTAHGLRATFFVESLFADVCGAERLRKLTADIAAQGHDAQLHVHPEWMGRTPRPPLASRGRNLKDFPASEQTELIALAARALQDAAGRPVRAFRAGNYGADFGTLKALQANGIRLDSSYARPHLGRPCALHIEAPLAQPAWVDGVLEFPLGYFEDWPGHYRTLQLCACSTSELIWALGEAWKRRWQYIVIVLHSFELLQRPREFGGASRPDRQLVQRFERLCRFLAGDRQCFRTVTFSDIEPDDVRPVGDQAPLRSHPLRTAWRYVEQAQGRLCAWRTASGPRTPSFRMR